MVYIQKPTFLIALAILCFFAFECFGCHKEERSALLQLKAVINHPNGNLLDDWKEEDMGKPSNCCEWERVSCGKSGNVISLSLDSLRQTEIQGDWYLNASIFLPFQQLECLDLSFNSVTGWDEHLREISSLKKLYLTYNKLRGMIDVYDLEALKNLEILDLSYNYVEGFKRINGTRRNKSKLETLFLYNTRFHDLHMLLEFPSLKFLYLMNNDLRTSFTTNVSQGLSQLEVLLLSGSSLSKDFLGEVGSMASLKMLMVDTYALNGDISSHEWLCQLKKLEWLDISQNNLHGEFPLCFGNLTSLQHLDMRQNNFYGRLSLSLENLTSLHFLDLSSNQFVGNIANSPLHKLKSLHHLSLSNNKFQIPQTLSSFSNYSSLKVLWLDGNTMVLDSAHQTFTHTFQLLFLSLSNCNLQTKLPNFIIHQQKLVYLDLSHNNIGASFPSWILENNTHLGVLLLDHNMLNGSLHFLRTLSIQVKALDVSCNDITSLSSNLSQSVPNIEFLNFSRNSIKHITPSTFVGMENLGLLDLSYNNLSRKLPNFFIKGCISLQILILSHNTLERITSLSNSSSLRILLVNDNNISGMIPSSLFLPSLIALDIGNNNLNGFIPKELCKLEYLHFLDLSNNNLFGFLPFCFKTEHLTHVYLNKNNLHGPFLHAFKNSTSLVTLDLGDNHSSDVIPEWIGSLRSLSILSLHNNHLQGHIPTQICALEQLTILDLSNNNLSGIIPHCISQISFQPLKLKSIDKEGFEDFPQIIDQLNDLSVTEQNDIDMIHQDFIIQNVMEITTKSHTYTYEGIDLDGMSILDLSGNKLWGDIPPEIGSIFGVRALNLSHNELTGSIPSTLSNLIQMESLDLSYNSLNGIIPVELIQLTALGVFSVAHNNLSGKTPEAKNQFGTFEASSYEGNPFLCGPPLMKDCSTSSLSDPKDGCKDRVTDSMDLQVFYVSFCVSSTIIFVGTLIVLYVNPYWREVWFYYGEMWITLIYYFVLDNMVKVQKLASVNYAIF